MKNIKPIYVMNQKGLPDFEKKAVLDGVSELLELANVGDIKIYDGGAWRHEGYLDKNNELKKFHSVDWYLEVGKKESRNKNQLNADSMQRVLALEPWRYPHLGGENHYDIFIINDDMYSKGTNFVIGIAQQKIGTIISTYQFKKLRGDWGMKYDYIKTETMHELGHVFGLPSKSRTRNIEESLGKHCTNICVMRQGLILPDDWIRMTNDRLKSGGALCRDCRKDLRDFFGG
ncbi:MAG: hypothetical protein KKA64_04810 [Nanoarchaeota archaeon]|nr:hypothetical protein [Nanoarchaeota archaeon]